MASESKDTTPANVDDVLEQAREATLTERDAQAATASPVGARPFALDNSLANQLARTRRPTVLVLAGQAESGKTSVYAAIYERLSRGPFGGWAFGGSQTITGFEARCHYWRETSNRSAPTMGHTNPEDLPWLHLQLQDETAQRERLELLLGDFDGEYFKQLLSNQLTVHDLPFLRRADHVGVVVDGARLADRAELQAERSSISYLINALRTPGGLASSAALSLMVTKIDLVDQIEDEPHRQAIDETIADLAVLAAAGGPSPPILRLAARSQTDRFPLGHGLEALLELLSVRPRQQATYAPPPVPANTWRDRFRA